MASGTRQQSLSRLATVNWVRPLTTALAGDNILSNYGHVRRSYGAPQAGTVNVSIAVDTRSTLSYQLVRPSSAVTLLNAGASLNPDSLYAFGVPVRHGEIIDFFLGTTAMFFVFDVWFVSRQ